MFPLTKGPLNPGGGVPARSRYQAMYQNKLQTIKARIEVNRVHSNLSRGQPTIGSTMSQDSQLMQSRKNQIPKKAGFGVPSGSNTRNHQNISDTSMSNLRKSNYVENAKRKFVRKN